jgi:hypothetical protein
MMTSSDRNKLAHYRRLLLQRRDVNFLVALSRALERIVGKFTLLLDIKSSLTESYALQVDCAFQLDGQAGARLAILGTV